MKPENFDQGISILIKYKVRVVIKASNNMLVASIHDADGALSAQSVETAFNEQPKGPPFEVTNISTDRVGLSYEYFNEPALIEVISGDDGVSVNVYDDLDTTLFETWVAWSELGVEPEDENSFQP